MMKRIKKWIKVHFYKTNPEWKFLKFNCGDKLNPIFYKQDNGTTTIKGVYMNSKIRYYTDNRYSYIYLAVIDSPYIKGKHILSCQEILDVNKNRYRWNYNYDFAPIIKYSKIGNEIETKYHNDVINNYYRNAK